MSMTNLTIAILARNEEANLAELLPTLAFVNEVIIIDDNSTNNTAKIPKKYRAKVLRHNLNSDFSQQRQFALTKSKNNWVMFMDADERLTNELKHFLVNFNPAKNISGYSFKRIDWFYNKPIRHGEVANVMMTRLVNRKLGHFIRPVHEVWSSKYKTIAKPNLQLYHYPHPSISEFLKHVNFYSTINAQYLRKSGRNKPRMLEIMFVPLGKFIYTYFMRCGFLDGARGFIYSFMMSFHSFLTRSKLYMLYQ